MLKCVKHLIIRKIKHAKMCQTFDNPKKGKIKHVKMCKT